MKRLIASLVLSVATLPVLAAGGGAKLQSAQIDIGNKPSLQRGAKLFMNYCGSCHSLGFLRYSRIGQDLGIDEAAVMANLNFTGAKYGERIEVAMRAEDGTRWFGAAPPDLSLTARARGVDWIYTYLKSFYLDDSRAVGWNNTVLAGASMPHVLWELQGPQRVVTEPRQRAADGTEQPCAVAEVAGACFVRFEPVAAGTLDARAYDQAIRDITAFMAYAAEPAALERQRYGLWVILFLVVFTFLAWLVKNEYWRDQH